VSIVEGRPYEAIIETAREKGVDLIVMGSHGRTGMERLLMGSVTERVVGHADCAVLIVKS
jgi:nucleotide-binding universal stress UspA family protein